MPTVGDVLAAVEDLAPPRYAFEFDRVGLQVGDALAGANGVVTTLDCTNDALAYAETKGANVVVAHHPVIWDPLPRLDLADARARLASTALTKGIAVIAAHTNWDAAPGGINDTLASVIGLADVRPFGSSSDRAAFKLVAFVPSENAEAMIEALSKAGCGRIGLYERCAFMSTGQGTFRGLEGSDPRIGVPGRVETVEEKRLEMIVPKESLSKAIGALKAAHPYEEPAFDVVPLQGGNGYPIGRIGSLPEPLSLDRFAAQAQQSLGGPCLVWRSPKDQVQVVAVVGGAADDEWKAAAAEGADVFLTGEVRHHNSIEAPREGLAMAAGGHFATENPGMRALSEALRLRLPGLACCHFEPGAGISGRPL
ncbi:MAG: Nif3-like dinuclear metal center hexameric protein [Armatimonadetes bacterium]|nr:Nif3-like dinuclear metal center hexameric protein [Armatimonadota bacterium]